MFSDAYITLEDQQAVTLTEQVNNLLDGSPFDPAQSRILSHSLPFYNGYHLCEMNDLKNTPPRQVSFIYKDTNGKIDDIFILDGTNEPIYELNKKIPIYLNKKNITTYVQFFFHYVRGRFGRFNIVENVDEILWREEPAPAGRRALSKMIEPLMLKNAASQPEDSENYHLSCNIIFKDSLFESDVIVKQNGDVALSNQEMLVEDIPVLDDSFKQ